MAAISITLAGCGGAAPSMHPANELFSVSPSVSRIDTNCTGCNAVNARGAAVTQFVATRNDGNPADVAWSVWGGDQVAGAGAISADGQYTPPTYLTADRARVFVTASLKSNPNVQATSVLTMTPGFMQPLKPENAALGANQTLAINAVLAEAGGSGEIHFALSDTPAGSAGGQGSLGTVSCQRSERTFTLCSVTYTAPPAVAANGVTYVVASIDGSVAKTETAVLLNPAGVSSSPVDHQELFAEHMLLGASGGNNNDFDTSGNTVVDCCSGTLGSLVQDGSGRQYLLSNNHVLARSDHAAPGDAIVQPGLIDNNCTPNGEGAGTVPVGFLTEWLPLNSSSTNVDAAIAEVASSTVDPNGRILELGGREADGTLAPASPGISSSGGKGEAAELGMRVAKSGRTTGLTCGNISAIGMDIAVDYYRDCAETKPYLTKSFTNQIAVSGDRFSDAGDSGALVVDTSNAEPLGLYFAGGSDSLGVSHAVANPAPDVLAELNAEAGSGTNFTYVGSADHPVSCLSYGNSTVAAAQAQPLSADAIAQAQDALASARQLVNPSAGILGVAMGKSSDRAGEAAVIVYISDGATTSVPQVIEGVRTLVIPSNARDVALGAAPITAPIDTVPALSAAVLRQAMTIKQRVAHGLMQQQPAFFGVGVGQSLDNPREAALVIFVDRKNVPASLPQATGGLRIRYVVMDRLHVTRSYAATFAVTRHCSPHPDDSSSRTFDPNDLLAPRSLDLPQQ